MGGYVKIIAANRVYEAKIIKLSKDGELIIQLLNGRKVILDSNDVTITSLEDDN